MWFPVPIYAQNRLGVWMVFETPRQVDSSVALVCGSFPIKFWSRAWLGTWMGSNRILGIVCLSCSFITSFLLRSYARKIRQSERFETLGLVDLSGRYLGCTRGLVALLSTTLTHFGQNLSPLSSMVLQRHVRAEFLRSTFRCCVSKAYLAPLQ